MKVIKLLRIKIIIAIVAVQIFIFVLFFSVLNFGITASKNHSAKNFLTQLAENGGHRPRPDNFPQASLPFLNPRDLRNYFCVNISYSGAINAVITDFPPSYTEGEISEIVLLIRSSGKSYGTIENFQYLKTPAKYGTFLLCILNRTEDFRILHQLRFFSLWTVLGVTAVSFAIAFFLSKITLAQADEAFEKQKRFIADAGHELKTPIAVIGANIDVLSSDEKLNSNKFFQYIKRENERMGELVRDLLYLARDDADRLEMIKSEFDFSNAVENAVLPFEVVAFESGMTLEMEIQKGITCIGDEKSLKQLFVILVDNAIKNSDKGAKITVKAYTERQNIIYKVRNTGNGIRKADLQKIFQRFYRVDTSRTRKTGGYGLGLSIAQTIAQKHGGTIKAESEYGKWAEFTFKMKN